VKEQRSSWDDLPPIPEVADTTEVDDSEFGFEEYGTPSPFTPEYWEHFLDDLTEEDYGPPGKRTITADELRAAGAFDYPPGSRTSLRVDREPFSGLFRKEHFEEED
jgi:hypothetical protein